jgi:hypothetical protein
MADDYGIHLNFLPVLGGLPNFRVYRKLRSDPQETRPEEGDVHAYSLPRKDCDLEDRTSYWVSMEQRPGFDEFTVGPAFNHHLTRWILFKALCDEVLLKLDREEFWISEHGFLYEIYFHMRAHDEGDEQLIVQPYFLRVVRKFGFLVDFHLRLRENVKFSRRVQQLSLSLDENFKRNLDYYVDRIAKMNSFVNERRHVLSSIRLPGTDAPVGLSLEFQSLPAELLRSRIYRFGSNKEARSQFHGLMEYGPLTPLPSPLKLLFVFREQDRQAARTLAVALRGPRQGERFSFPGFERLFKTPLTIDPNPVVVPDFSIDSMSVALNRSQREDGLSVPILAIPDGDESGYLNHKALFAHAGIPTQVCTLDVIQDENTLKWSVANIALQIFCKAGGLPWKVRPTGENCLIIGISQSHKIRSEAPRHTVEKYFAFSVLTDSSGIFQKIQVLAHADDEGSYLQQLRTKLREILISSVQSFSQVVIHTSFKLRLKEIDEIQHVAQETARMVDETKCRFAVVKVNHKSRFFGINRSVNSLVPYEGTRVRLGHDEYLVWFEGILPDKRTVTKKFPGPTHLQFLRMSDKAEIAKGTLLQDLVNLSGANWRGFNAKSAPVSVFYCHLVADLVHDFHERGLPLPAVEGARPWFL